MQRFLYKHLVKPILFRIDPEKVHDAFTFLGTFLGKHTRTRACIKKLYDYQHPALTQNILGITFQNPIELSLYNLLPA